MELSTFAQRIKMTNSSCRSKINIFGLICPNTRFYLIVIHSRHPQVNVHTPAPYRENSGAHHCCWPRIVRLHNSLSLRIIFDVVNSSIYPLTFSLMVSAPFSANVFLLLLRCECQSGKIPVEPYKKDFHFFRGS